MRLHHLLYITAAIAVAAPSATAQWSIDTGVQEDRALMIEMVENFIASPEDPTAFGYWNQLVAAAGREDLIAAAQADGHGYSMLCDMGEPLTLAPLLEAAGATSIVIIGEDHARPAHRLFAGALAEALRPLGYEYYAAETFTQEIGETGHAYTQLADGYYTRDPVYADVLNGIRALGYSLVAYEETEEQAAPDDASIDVRIETREQAQTDNLMTRLLKERPDAKVIIHVGFAHAQEFPGPGGAHWMAARLKAASGIDPLTISLSDCRTSGADAVLAEFAEQPDGKGIARQTDYYIGFPDIDFQAGRPAYRLKAGYQATSVPDDLLPEDRAVLIEARRPDAPDTEMPLDRLYLRPGESLPLMLRAGEYDVRSFDSDGLAAGPVAMTVSAGSPD